MSDISQIEINGTTYDLKDTVARASSGGGGDTPSDIAIYNEQLSASGTKIYTCHGTKKSVYRLTINGRSLYGSTTKTSLDYKLSSTSTPIAVLSQMVGDTSQLPVSAAPFCINRWRSSNYPADCILEFIVLPGGSITITSAVDVTDIHGLEYIYN